VHYEHYPSGAAGSQTYDKVFMYRQGIAITFRTTGTLYKFDWQYVINVLLGGLVFLFAAKMVANFVALYLMGGISKMIRNRTRETFDIQGRYAEIGMKAALAAMQFHRIDDDADGVIEVEDLVVAFAHLHGVTAEQAVAIGRVVLAHADKDGASKEKARAKVSATSITNPSGKEGLDFSEFLVAREGGQMIGFDKYLGLVEKEAAKGIKRESKSMTDEQMKALFHATRLKAHASPSRPSTSVALKEAASSDGLNVEEPSPGPQVPIRVEALKDV